MTRTLLLALLFATGLVGVARADLIPPEVEACNSLSLGSACGTGILSSGTCQNSTCSRADYEHWDRDASPRPTTYVYYDCLKCLPGGARTATASTTSTGANTGTGAATTSGTGTGAITATGTGTGATGTGTPTAATTSTGMGSLTEATTSTNATSTTITSTATAAETTPSTSTGTGAITAATTGTGTGVPTDPGTGTLTNAGTATQTGTGDKDSKDSSGCSVSGVRAMAPWLLAGAFAALVRLVRRRPRG